jgi:HK97 family phage major capsid protein
MSVLQLRKQRKELLDKMRPLAAKPSLKDNERIMWNNLKEEIGRIDREYASAVEDLEVRNILESKTHFNRELSRYSLRRAIELKLSRQKLDGLELEMHREAEREALELGLKPIIGIGVPSMIRYKPLARASTGQNVTTAGDGGNLAQEEPILFIEALRNSMMLPQMGARYMTGLVGDLPLSVGGTFAGTWMAEDTTATPGKMTFGKKTLKPKRLQSVGVLSRKLLLQATPDAEALVETEILDGIAQAVQTAAINGSGEAPVPTGILQTEGIGIVPGGDNGAEATNTHMIALETEVTKDNALLKPQFASYLTNAVLRGKLRQTFKNPTYGDIPIWERGPLPGVGEINGYPAWVTNAVPSTLTKGSASGVCSAIIFGVWDQLFIGQWGGYDIIIDPYSLSNIAEVKLTVVSHFDTGVGHPESFAAMVDALTT